MTQAKILVIDDNPMNLELFTDLLELRGCIVIGAENAEIGIEYAKSEHPDLILMDVQLPGMDGLTATRKLSDNPDTNHIPIVAITSHAMVGEEELFKQAGSAGYLSKPIDTRLFADEIEHYLQDT